MAVSIVPCLPDCLNRYQDGNDAVTPAVLRERPRDISHDVVNNEDAAADLPREQ